MKYEKREKQNLNSNAYLKKKTELDNNVLKTDSKHIEDIFQVELYNSGTQLLKKLKGIENISGYISSSHDTYEKLKKELTQLRDFTFNIGFAGGMCSGKSTVINSLIEYPLMPTCKLTTTCVGTHIFYGEKPRLTVIDDDTKKRVLDIDCTNISQMHFQKLKEYACEVMHLKVVENLQYFTNHNIFQDKDSIQPEMLQMSKNNPNHVIVLLMILLTVYVDQNSGIKSSKALSANKKRIEILSNYFNFPVSTVNYTIQLQWNGDFFKSGITITDLPGLGAYAPDKDIGDGKTIKGHDSISTKAIIDSDAMVFLVDPQVDGTGVPALEAMISNAKLKEVANKSDLIIPVLNKIDDCKGQKGLIDAAVEKFLDILTNTGVVKTSEDIHLYSAWYGEYKFKDFPVKNTCFYNMNVDQKRISQKNTLKSMPMFNHMSDSEIDNLVEPTLEETIRNDLAENYKNSGIEELKKFFRTSYIGKSKNLRSYAIVLEIIKLASEIIPTMEMNLNNIDLLHNITEQVIVDISNKLKDNINKPISEALREREKKMKENMLHNKFVNSMLDIIPELYISAFNNALEEYKIRNIEICKKFERWNRFSDKALISQLGSNNARNYQNLIDEMSRLCTDVKKINGQFSEVLDYVTSNLEAVYNDALSILESLKISISISLNKYADNYKKSLEEKNNVSLEEKNDVLKSVNSLKKTLIQYMERQINVIIDSMKTNHNNIAKTGNNTVENMLDLNANMINLFTKSVLNDVKNTLSKGDFFKKREYIDVTGSNGVINAFNKLKLSQADINYIKGEVCSIGISDITNNLNIWYQETEDIIGNSIIELREKSIKIIDNTVSVLCNNSEDITKNKEKMKKLLDETKKVFIELQYGTKSSNNSRIGGIQPFFDESLSVTENEIMNKYKKNIFSGVIEITEEELSDEKANI